MTLSRKKQRMPSFVKEALVKNKLVDKYKDRPEHQRNDYLWWISSAKQEETKQKRLKQMLNELKVGGVYMKMKHNPSRKK